MHKARLAQWLLARVSTKQRASEIIGDILEQHNRSATAFWFTVMRIVVALSWRWMLGLVAAFFSWLIALALYRFFVASKHHAPLHFEAWMAWSNWLLIASFCLWTLTALTSFRYGIRDSLTRISVALSLILTISACFAWLPFATYFIAGVLTVSLSFLLLHHSLRQACFCILCASGALVLMFFFLAGAMNLIVSNRSTYHDLAGIPIWVVSICAEAWILARIRHHLLEPQAPSGLDLRTSTTLESF
jgi:hypothetical protein